MLAPGAGRAGSKCSKKQGRRNILIVGYRKQGFGAGSQSGTKFRCNGLRNAPAESAPRAPSKWCTEAPRPATSSNASRPVEQLSEELKEKGAEVDELTARLARLEALMGARANAAND